MTACAPHARQGVNYQLSKCMAQVKLGELSNYLNCLCDHIVLECFIVSDSSEEVLSFGQCATGSMHRASSFLSRSSVFLHLPHGLKGLLGLKSHHYHLPFLTDKFSGEARCTQVTCPSDQSVDQSGLQSFIVCPPTWNSDI